MPEVKRTDALRLSQKYFTNTIMLKPFSGLQNKCTASETSTKRILQHPKVCSFHPLQLFKILTKLIHFTLLSSLIDIEEDAAIEQINTGSSNPKLRIVKSKQKENASFQLSNSRVSLHLSFLTDLQLCSSADSALLLTLQQHSSLL